MKKKVSHIAAMKAAATTLDSGNAEAPRRHQLAAFRPARLIIREARQQVMRAADVVQVRTCWLVGCHIVDFEQGGAARAAYGKDLLAAGLRTVDCRSCAEVRSLESIQDESVLPALPKFRRTASKFAAGATTACCSA